MTKLTRLAERRAIKRRPRAHRIYAKRFYRHKYVVFQAHARFIFTRRSRSYGRSTTVAFYPFAERLVIDGNYAPIERHQLRLSAKTRATHRVLSFTRTLITAMLSILIYITIISYRIMIVICVGDRVIYKMSDK